MKSRLALLLFIAACSSKSTESAPGSASASGSASSAAGSAEASAGSAAGRPRDKIDCAGVISGSESAMGTKFAPGWGPIPKDLQLLPPDGELCGNVVTNGNTAAFVRSPIFGQALADLYAPVAVPAKCGMKVDIKGNGEVQISLVQMRCGDRVRMTAVTNSTYDFYSVQVMAD